MSAPGHGGAAWALVPVKSLGEAKMRLVPVLSGEERAALQLAMLADVLAALRRAGELAGTAIVTTDPRAAATARRFGATVLDEPLGQRGLNAAVAAGAVHLCGGGATIVAVIPADLPLADAADIDCALARVRESGMTRVVPDRRRRGTNALVFRCDARPDFAFGPGSFRRHRAGRGAGAAGALPLASLALDIDTPADLKALAAHGVDAIGRNTAAVLSGLAGRIAAHPVTEVEA